MHLTRKRITAVAMDLIERDGFDALSMPRLAAVLGCGVVSLYCYVPSKAALLDGVAEAVMSGVKSPSAGVRPVDPARWLEQLRAQVMAFHQIARQHPRCAMAVVSRRPSSAATLRPVEDALATLADAGFGYPDSVRIIRALTAYVMGSMLDEIGVAADLDADDEHARRPRLRAREFPHLVALAAEHAGSDPDADFEFGLDLLLRAIAAVQRTQANATRQAS